jgi:hypothetical protein
MMDLSDTATRTPPGARHWRAVLALVALFGLTAPAARPVPALAGTYDVYSCEQPNYSAAPIDGWTATTNNANVETENECGEGGFMWAAVLGDRDTPVGAEAAWSFLPPRGTAIHEAILYRFFNNGDNEDTGGGFTYENLKAPYRFSAPFERCGESAAYHYECSGTGLFMGRTAPNTEVKVPAKDLVPERGGGPAPGIYVIAGCFGTQSIEGEHCNGGTEGAIGYAGLSGATITLEDNSAPTVTAVGGTLTSGTELEGEQNLAITGSDSGSGIYQAILEIDGKPTATTTVDNNNGHCESVGSAPDGRPAFLYTVPCGLEVNDQYVFFNMAGIPDGSHALSVVVTDAAGNATTVLSRQVVVGRGACNGSCDDQAKLAVSDPKLLKPQTRPYKHSALMLSGSLREPSGAPVGGASLEVMQQPSYIGAPLRRIATGTTNAQGQWTVTVPRGPSRVLLVGWRSHALDGNFASVLEYHERVLADIQLTAPRKVRAGVPFAFHGKLIGGYVPREGDIVQVEIRYLGRWRTIETVRSNRRGAFAYGYTFSEGIGGAYLFRASIRNSSNYPYLARASLPVRVKVR